MTGNESPSPFELTAGELRPLGITIARLPGEYRVNFRNGADATMRTAETLDEALALGRAMAADRVAAPSSPRRYRRPRRMTPKAIRRRMIRAHNRRLRSRALKNRHEDG